MKPKLAYTNQELTAFANSAFHELQLNVGATLHQSSNHSSLQAKCQMYKIKLPLSKCQEGLFTIVWETLDVCS